MSTLDYEHRYPSARMPVLARNVVATSQPLASQAGIRMLLEGGNAVDAALAGAIALTVVEPTSNGLGSDASAIVWDGSGLHGLNASGRSPGALDPNHLVGATEMPLRGWHTVTVPGAVSGWVALSKRFGRLPFERLFHPAIAYARNGFPVSPITAHFWSTVAGDYADYPDFAKYFLPNGRVPAPGEVFRFEEQARTLELIAESEGAALYHGELADRIAAYSDESGGLLTGSDLAMHQSEWCDTISQAFGDVELHELPPNGQGLAALIMLGLLENVPFCDHAVDSVDSLHLQIEAMKLALVDVRRYVAEPACMEVSATDFLDAGYLTDRARLLDVKMARDPGHGVPRSGGTVYLTSADADGIMVSLIQSNCSNFGSGLVVPGTGISLQNRGSFFTLEPGHPNQVGGYKRPFNTIMPGFVTCGGMPLMSFGVIGGPMQPQGHAQMVIRTCFFGQNPQVAADAPRWRVMSGLEVAVEKGFPADVLEGLRQRGHRITEYGVRESYLFGGAQLIYRLDDGYVAGSDQRRDGQAVGY
ncbi:MAG: gamma-glutamyltransferase family protein [Trueperaceae bacterium]